MRTSLAPLAHRSFRLLFTAQAIWLLGSWMTPVALAFAVLSLTDSPAALGLVLGAEAVPMTLLLLVGGVWADRLPRVRVMVTADLVSFVSQGTLALLLIAGTAEIWQLAALAAVGGAADAFHTPAWSGLLPETVPRPAAAAGERASPPRVERLPGGRAAAGRPDRGRRRTRLGDRRRRALVPGRRCHPGWHPWARPRAGGRGARLPA